MKYISTILIGVLIAGSIWAQKLVWGKPTNFNLFIERVFLKRALADPELMTFLGLIENGPFDFHSGKLTDISYAKNMQLLQEIQSDLATLHTYSRASLAPQEQLTYDILEYDLQNMLTTESFGYGSLLNAYAFQDPNPYLVNQLFGMQSSLVEFMVNIHQIANKKSAENYIARLSEWDKKFDDLIEELKRRQQNGVIPPLFIIEKVIDEMQRFTATLAEQNILYTSFLEKLQAIDLLDREALQAQALKTIETIVYPAYEKLIAFQQTQMTLATRDAGVWKLPNGDAYYLHCLKYQTTTDYSPAEIHALGLSEVSHIQREMKQILEQLGYAGQDIRKSMQNLNRDPRFLYPDSAEGREQVLSDYRQIFETIHDKLPSLFLHFPKAALKIEAIPDFKAQTSPSTYYEPSDLKGTRPGIFYVNCHDIGNCIKFSMPTIAYHEGIPGHHFQISLAQEIPNLPLFRRFANFTAYAEGWALYCEQLGLEYDFTTDPYCNLGSLQAQLWRAVRLVVDTGLHYKRWNREEAIQYMMENTGLNESAVVAEIERYIVMPGQACSYKIGMIKILELREAMKKRLGSSFDIREFHEKILHNGSMPLTLLEQSCLGSE